MHKDFWTLLNFSSVSPTNRRTIKEDYLECERPIETKCASIPDGWVAHLPLIEFVYNSSYQMGWLCTNQCMGKEFNRTCITYYKFYERI